jgi:hypothetical protein
VPDRFDRFGSLRASGEPPPRTARARLAAEAAGSRDPDSQACRMPLKRHDLTTVSTTRQRAHKWPHTASEVRVEPTTNFHRKLTAEPRA